MTLIVGSDPGVGQTQGLRLTTTLVSQNQCERAADQAARTVARQRNQFRVDAVVVTEGLNVFPKRLGILDGCRKCILRAQPVIESKNDSSASCRKQRAEVVVREMVHDDQSTLMKKEHSGLRARV